MSRYRGSDLYLCNVRRVQGTITSLDLFPVRSFEDELMERFLFVLDDPLFASTNLVLAGSG